MSVSFYSLKQFYAHINSINFNFQTLYECYENTKFKFQSQYAFAVLKDNYDTDINYTYTYSIDNYIISDFYGDEFFDFAGIDNIELSRSYAEICIPVSCKLDLKKSLCNVNINTKILPDDSYNYGINLLIFTPNEKVVKIKLAKIDICNSILLYDTTQYFDNVLKKYIYLDDFFEECSYLFDSGNIFVPIHFNFKLIKKLLSPQYVAR